MEKIKELKKILIREKIDGYLIPKNDEFFGEYVPYDKDRLNFIIEESNKILVKAQARLEALEYIPSGLQ